MTLEHLPIDEEQDKDPAILQIKHRLAAFPDQRSNFTILDQVLYRKTDSLPDRLVIPSHLKLSLLKMFHGASLAGHVGKNKMIFNITQRFYWPNLHEEVSNFVKTCEVCIRFKARKLQNQGLLHPITTSFPFEIVCSDIAGPFKQTARGNKYVLVCMCMFTNWVEVCPLKSLEAEELVDRIMEYIFLRHGCPENLLTDQGRNYASQLLKAFCGRLGITKLQTTPYHPQGNGKAEVFMKFLVSNLATLGEKDQSNWDLLLPTVAFIHNTTINDTLQETPFYLVHGRDPLLPADLQFGHHTRKFDTEETNRFEYKVHLVKLLKRNYEIVQNRRGDRQARLTEKVNQRRKAVEFQLGEEVMLHWPMPKKGLSQKLLPKWSGPYRILRRLGEVTYRIGLNQTKTMVVHVQRLRKLDVRTVR
jgi:transposase InsO family protein